MKPEKPWPEYVCTYRFDGAEYGLTIPARNEAEVSRRLRAIGMTAQVDGELLAVIPARSGAGLLVRLWIALANLFGGR